MTQTSRAASVLLLTVIIAAASAARAQLYSGSISGVVRDSSGAVLPKAAVTETVAFRSTGVPKFLVSLDLTWLSAVSE